MTKILDSREEIGKIDPNFGLQSLEEMGSQIKQVWDETRDLNFPEDYKQVQNIVVAGMGGSAYGTHVLVTLFKEELKVPVFSIPDYKLPAWVNEHTLVVLSSYSGTTEETLSAAEDAKAKHAKITGLTSGGKLKEFLAAGKYPCYIFDPKFNPSKQPRFAIGYSIFGQMALLARAGFLSLEEADFNEVLTVIAKAQLRLSADVVTDKNESKLLAFELAARIPIVTVAEHLEGMAHVTANFFNETAKTYSEYRVIPELNHHLMEGLAFPKSNEANLLFLLVHSDLYAKSNEKRMKLTAEVIEKNHCEFREVHLSATTKIGQVFEWLVLGVYAAYYLAIINAQDPVAIPWVNWFKTELNK